MRKIWSILLFALICNVTSLVARTSMLEQVTANQIQCYIDEQKEDYSLTDHTQHFAMQQIEVSSVGAARTSGEESNTAKNLTSTHHKCSHNELHHGLYNKAYIASHREPHAHLFSRIKDHYIYALRHIII